MFFVQAAQSKVGKKPLLRSGNRCLTIKTKKEMKKNLFMVAAVALVALVSCNKETDSPVQPAPVSDIKFEAEFVNEQTKTSIGDAENGYRTVTWELGDLVHINGTLFTATGRKEDGKAIFETENLDFATAEQYNAIYPASAGTSLAAVTIPAAQDGTFANAAIAVAQSENRSLAFMNVASLIKFQVPAAYSTVTIESTANLAGAVSVSFNEDGVPVIGEVTNASKKITLENVKADVDYYVAVLPGDHKFTFNLDGRLSKEASNTLTATRAGILALGELPKPAKLDRNLAFSPATVSVKLTETFTAPTLSGVKDGVTYKSSNTAVATVNASTGAVTLVADGETTITASAEATEVYNAGSASYKLTVVKPDPVYVYVKNDMGWSTVNIYGYEKANDKNMFTSAWPGTKMTTTETVNGTSFFKFELPASFVGKQVGIVFNNGTKQLSDYVETINTTTYLRLTPGTPIVVDPQNKSSFKYRIYVYDQAKKKKNVNIYYWGTGYTSPSWPGTRITNYVDYDYKSLGYYEIPAAAYSGKTFNYLINVNGDELKTGDLSVVNPTSDLVIGYWDNGSQKGFWMNGTKPYTNADSCN